MIVPRFLKAAKSFVFFLSYLFSFFSFRLFTIFTTMDTSMHYPLLLRLYIIPVKPLPPKSPIFIPIVRIFAVFVTQVALIKTETIFRMTEQKLKFRVLTFGCVPAALMQIRLTFLSTALHIPLSLAPSNIMISVSFFLPAQTSARSAIPAVIALTGANGQNETVTKILFCM